MRTQRDGDGDPGCATPGSTVSPLAAVPRDPDVDGERARPPHAVARDRSEPPAAPRFPLDWPRGGAIDLARHDLPHASSTSERWHLHAHLSGPGGETFSVSTAFVRRSAPASPAAGAEHIHALTWAVSDVERGQYHARSYVEAGAARGGLERIRAGRGARDERVDRALAEVLARGRVPRPERAFPRQPRISPDPLDLDFGPCRLRRPRDGQYHLALEDAGPEGPVRVDLTFFARRPPVRHGHYGLVRGADGEDLFACFVPRCGVSGSVNLGDARVPIPVTGVGWYDRDFGRPPPAEERDDDAPGSAARCWLAIQLDDGTAVSACDLVHPATGACLGRCAVLVDAAGKRTTYPDFKLTAPEEWRSSVTFDRYPTRLVLTIPAARLALEVRAAFPEQERVAALGRPSAWEGRCEVAGTVGGSAVRGAAHLERSCASEGTTLEAFFARVGEAVRASVRAFAPLELDRAHALALAAAPGREHYLDGVDLAQLSRTLVAPVRAITDRGGKAWRSCAALVACELVGGDAQRLAGWLAFPELLHTGSLIVEDVQRDAPVRRRGPAAHLMYGDAIAVNAGTAAYFMAEQLLARSPVDDATRLRLYALYFEALRAGHAGQAIALDGLAMFVPAALASGEFRPLEQRVLAVHRLRTAAPASALARMGAVAGGGTAEQVEAVGAYFDALGLAFQIVEDVLDLRGADGAAPRGDAVSSGRVSLPIAKALALLDRRAGRELWRLVSSRPTDPSIVASAIAQVEGCGAIEACRTQAAALVERAWARLAPLADDSLATVMLRAFGWYAVERRA